MPENVVSYNTIQVASSIYNKNAHLWTELAA